MLFSHFLYSNFSIYHVNMYWLYAILIGFALTIYIYTIFLYFIQKILFFFRFSTVANCDVKYLYLYRFIVEPFLPKMNDELEEIVRSFFFPFGVVRWCQPTMTDKRLFWLSARNKSIRTIWRLNYACDEWVITGCRWVYTATLC